MGTVTVKISTSSKKGKHLVGLIQELAKTDKGIEVFDSPVPNKITLKALKEAEKGNVRQAKDVDELFNSI